MTKHVDVYFTPNSPWTFLAWERLHEMAERQGAELAYHPIDFGVVFPATGGLPLPKRSPERQAYRMMELKRWKAFLGFAAFKIEPRFFPVDADPALRLLIAARAAGADVGALSGAIMAAVWCEDRDISDPATLEAIATNLGLDAAGLDAAANSAAIGARLRAESEAAVARGVFGAPTFVFRDEIFWGQDRLDFLDRALAAD